MSRKKILVPVSTDTFLCSLCFYSVLSLILFLMLGRQEKKGLFEIVHKRPKSLIYQFVLISLCLLLRHLHVFSNVLWNFFFSECICGFCRVGDVWSPISRLGVSLKGCFLWSTGCSCFLKKLWVLTGMIWLQYWLFFQWEVLIRSFQSGWSL